MPGVATEGVTIGLSDNNDGSYTVTVAITYTGNSVLSISHNGSALYNSPLTLVILPDEIAAANSTVSGAGIERVDVHGVNVFTIKPRDKFGNLLAYNAEWAVSFPFDVR